jgi:hypothetical protein
MAKYGFTGAKPTQSSSANTGVFGVNDVVELLGKGKFKLQGFDMQYLVLAGGGGGGRRGTATSGGAGGGTDGRIGGNAAANTGSGGGGGSYQGGGVQHIAGANGGSGVVILRYPDSFTIIDDLSSLTMSTATAGSDKVTTITAGTGSVSFS